MQVIIDIAPGQFTNSRDLELARLNIEIELIKAIGDVHRSAFPEYAFTVNTAPECCEPPF